MLFRRAINRSCFGRVDLVAGYRFARLDDGLQINEDVLTDATAPQLGDRHGLFPHAQRVQRRRTGSWSPQMARCGWSLETTVKLALGDTHNLVNIDGQTIIGTTTSAGGLLALPTNIGTYGSNQFSVLPELGVNLGYDLTEHLRATFGYSLIYWTAWRGRAIRSIWTSTPATSRRPQPGAGPAPAFVLHESNFWAQGLNFGLDFHF